MLEPEFSVARKVRPKLALEVNDSVGIKEGLKVLELASVELKNAPIVPNVLMEQVELGLNVRADVSVSDRVAVRLPNAESVGLVLELE